MLHEKLVCTTVMVVLFFLSSVCCGSNISSSPTGPDEKASDSYIKSIIESVDFLKKNAYSPEARVFYSDIDNKGRVSTSKVYLVSLSRTIYALSFSSKYVPENLALAKQSAEFLTENLIFEHDGLAYFLPEYDLSSGSSPKVRELDVWQQAYGLTGLVELYRNWPDPELFRIIELMHIAFVNRFSDLKNGGFWGRYSLENGPIFSSKSFQSTVYPVTAYMNNLWAISPNPKPLQALLSKHVQYAHDYLWDSAKNWINIRFDSDWGVCPNADGKCFSVAPGHNFQLAWLLLNTRNWTFISKENQHKYDILGRRIISATLEKEIWGESSKGGFFSEYDPSDSQRISHLKAWWQHSEAIIALSFYDPSSQKLKDLLDFFELSFKDRVYGGEYFYLDKDNRPILTEPKSSIGKSAYHTVEMYRFLIENL
ncbi:hypothetical protein NBRC116583_34670 [Arenicella sp. 4NH20-0111]|uniref:AGE family epimerase/isomerase n=1 Tax=Arenicella sp. 4NH20-0111 TaxID=3127648 RepID=UPI0031097C0C